MSKYFQEKQAFITNCFKKPLSEISICLSVCLSVCLLLDSVSACVVLVLCVGLCLHLFISEMNKAYIDGSLPPRHLSIPNTDYQLENLSEATLSSSWHNWGLWVLARIIQQTRGGRKYLLPTLTQVWAIIRTSGAWTLLLFSSHNFETLKTAAEPRNSTKS